MNFERSAFRLFFKDKIFGKVNLNREEVGNY